MNLRGEIGGQNYGSSTYYIRNKVDLNNKINETGLQSGLVLWPKMRGFRPFVWPNYKVNKKLLAI